MTRVMLAPSVAYEVRIWDVSARLHLNHAAEDELRALFLGLGAGYGEAEVAAQSILDWRDADDLHRARGAEWDDWYRHQARLVVPRNAPFRSLSELRQVRGMERLFPRAAPFLTVDGAGQVNLNTAPPAVLGTLSGIDEEIISLILNRRTGERPLRNMFELQQQLSSFAHQRLQREAVRLTARAAFDSNLLEVEATGFIEDSPIRYTIRALVAHTGSTVQVVRSFEE
jgi:type II secretory pathway component PulK